MPVYSVSFNYISNFINARVIAFPTFNSIVEWDKIAFYIGKVISNTLTT